MLPAPKMAYDIVDWNALWDVVKICGVGGLLHNVTISFHENSIVCVKVDGRLSEGFETGMGVRQGHVMSLSLFMIYMDGTETDEKKKRKRERERKLEVDGKL